MVQPVLVEAHRVEGELLKAQGPRVLLELSLSVSPADLEWAKAGGGGGGRGKGLENRGVSSDNHGEGVIEKHMIH